MRTLNIIALLLAVIGAINWGLVGLFGFNLVAALFGEMSALSRIIYVLVGIAGIYCCWFFPVVSRVGYRHEHAIP